MDRIDTINTANMIRFFQHQKMKRNNFLGIMGALWDEVEDEGKQKKSMVQPDRRAAGEERKGGPQ